MKNSIVDIIYKYLDFIKFCIVGLSNTLISLIIYYVLLKLHINYLISSGIAYFCGIFNGYFWSSRFVFVKKKNMNSAIKFFVVYMSSLVINLVLMYIFVDIFKINKILSQVITIGFNVLYNFILNKVWTFKYDNEI